LQDIVGPRVSQSPADRHSYARDLWPRSIIGLREGEATPFPPDVVVWPDSTEEVAAIVKLAARRHIALVPFGAGSGVCGGGAPVPDWVQLFIGSEGTLGVITRATLRLRPAPELRLLRGWEFPRVAAGCEAVRRMLQRGLKPAAVRLYDELDSYLHRASGSEGASAPAGPHELTELEKRVRAARKWLLKSALAYPGALNQALAAILPRLHCGCLLIVGFEGDRELAAAEAAVGSRELER